METILAGLATFERHLIRARTDEGRKRAQARGVKFGRPVKLTKHRSRRPLHGERQAKHSRRLDGATMSRTQQFLGSNEEPVEALARVGPPLAGHQHSWEVPMACTTIAQQSPN